jgi:hypothetical protein
VKNKCPAAVLDAATRSSEKRRTIKPTMLTRTPLEALSTTSLSQAKGTCIQSLRRRLCPRERSLKPQRI